MTKTKPLLLAGASVLLCASSLVVFVLEIDRAIAWIAPGSPRHNNRNQNQIKNQNQNRVVFLFSAVDESSSERLQEPQPPLPAAGQFSKHNTNNNYFTGSKEGTEGAIENKHEHGISKQKALPTEPMILEERLLSDHAALESFLSETDHETKQSASIVPDAPFIAEDVPREATLVDRSVYEFNNNLVNLMYSAISFLYPTTSLSQPFLAASLSSTLLGTKYNEETIEPERKTALRFEKFYVVQTVARIPYFAYLSVLHLRETYGDRGGSKGEKKDINKNQREVDLSSSFSLSNHQRIETMRTHYAQADNEFHHLLIMEALGGDSIREIDRILAHTMAFFYYWFVVALFSWNEQAAYHLNEVAEDHAYKIYEEVSNSARESRAMLCYII